MKKKYELLKTDTYNMNGKTLYRIIAIRNFGNIKKGELGGFVQNEKNLSHKGTCWIHDEAKVYENARVYGDAQVYNYTLIYGNARVYGNANLFVKVLITENARVYGNACLIGLTMVRHNVRIYGNARIIDSIISDKTRIYGNSFVDGCGVKIHGKSRIYDNAHITGQTEIIDTKVYDDSEIHNVRRIKQSNVHGKSKLIDYNDRRIKSMNIIDNKAYKKDADGGFIYI